SVRRSIFTSFGPPLTIPCILGEAGSSTQRLSLSSTTTLCTQMKCEPAGPGLFHSSLGNGFGWPFTISATEIEWSSDQKGKFTKTRPDFVETPTPVTC